MKASAKVEVFLYVGFTDTVMVGRSFVSVRIVFHNAWYVYNETLVFKPTYFLIWILFKL